MNVYLIGETRFPGHTGQAPNVDRWLTAHGLDSPERMKALNVGPLSASERIIILAARRCYRSFKPGLNPNVMKVRDDPKDFIYNILKSGHGSVLEHASATFALEGISRVCTHELVRHRIGVAISQESLRYVKLEEFDLVLPPELEDMALPEEIRFNLREAVKTLFSVANAEQTFEAKKRVTSAVRRVVPMGVSTGMVWTANFRALRWVLENRTSEAAEWEIRRLFNVVGDICLAQWPLIFQDFKKIPCADYPALFVFKPEFSKV